VADLGCERDRADRAEEELRLVRGLPGSGKTAVAAAVADGLRPAFPGGVLWASVGSNPSPLSVLASWGRALGADDLAATETSALPRPG